MADAFQCSVVTPEEKLIDGTVSYASIPAWDGQIGIAPHRAPLLVKLGMGPLRLDFAKTGQHKYVVVEGGFAQMLGDRLIILANKATPVENLVESDAREELEQALRIEARTDEEVERRHNAQQAARSKVHMARYASQRGI